MNNNIRKIKKQFTKCNKSIHPFIRQPNRDQLMGKLKDLSITLNNRKLKDLSITLNLDCLILYLYFAMIMIFLLIFSSLVIPHDGRLLLIFVLAVLNICGHFFIQQLQSKKHTQLMTDIVIVYCQRARQFVFLIATIIAIFIQIGRINPAVAFVFYFLNGLLIIINLGIHIQTMCNIYANDKAIYQATIEMKQRKETDSVFNKELKSSRVIGYKEDDNDDNIDVKYSDDHDNNHLKITITSSVQ